MMEHVGGQGVTPGGGGLPEEKHLSPGQQKVEDTVQKELSKPQETAPAPQGSKTLKPNPKLGGKVASVYQNTEFSHPHTNALIDKDQPVKIDPEFQKNVRMKALLKAVEKAGTTKEFQPALKEAMVFAIRKGFLGELAMLMEKIPPKSNLFQQALTEAKAAPGSEKHTLALQVEFVVALKTMLKTNDKEGLEELFRKSDKDPNFIKAFATVIGGYSEQKQMKAVEMLRNVARLHLSLEGFQEAVTFAASLEDRAMLRELLTCTFSRKLSELKPELQNNPFVKLMLVTHTASHYINSGNVDGLRSMFSQHSDDFLKEVFGPLAVELAEANNEPAMLVLTKATELEETYQELYSQLLDGLHQGNRDVISNTLNQLAEHGLLFDAHTQLRSEDLTKVSSKTDAFYFEKFTKSLPDNHVGKIMIAMELGAISALEMAVSHCIGDKTSTQVFQKLHDPSLQRDTKTFDQAYIKAMASKIYGIDITPEGRDYGGQLEILEFLKDAIKTGTLVSVVSELLQSANNKGQLKFMLQTLHATLGTISEFTSGYKNNPQVQNALDLLVSPPPQGK